MLTRFIEMIKFRKKYGGSPKVSQFIDEWAKIPEKHFFGYFGKPLDWSTMYNQGYFYALPDSHGISSLPDIRCEYIEYDYSLLIGNIEGIIMHSGGVVQIKHFALKTNLTRSNIGITFFKALLSFLKSKNAISVEFHEDHSSKIEHYRRFFEKLEINESKAGVWCVKLYDNNNIPNSVLSFQEELKRKSET